jgi:hypothetical protein
MTIKVYSSKALYEFLRSNLLRVIADGRFNLKSIAFDNFSLEKLKLIHKISKISTRAIFSKCIESGDMEEQF